MEKLSRKHGGWEPDFIENDFGDLIVNPNYNQNNQLKDSETKLKHYEEEYKRYLKITLIKLIKLMIAS